MDNNSMLVTVQYKDPDRGWVHSKVVVGSPAHKAVMGDPTHVNLLELYRAR